jgi:SAM-dependent methyltransferase
MLEECAIPGTHDLVVQLARKYVPGRGRALDLGAGSGALAEKLKDAGFEVLAVEIGDNFRAEGIPLLRLDLNDVRFQDRLSPGFDLISAVEVIEHLESPIAFLRSIRSLLGRGGVAVLTSPNVDNVAARCKFMMSGRIRTMDDHSDVHISPIFYDLFTRQCAPRAGLVVLEHQVFPENGFPLTARRYLVPIFKVLVEVLRGPTLQGDTNVFVVAAAQERANAV